MKPLELCPGCQSPFRRIKQNEGWHQELCDRRCSLDYAQFHQRSFEDDSIGYVTFDTKDFFIYAYYDHFGHKDLIYIYHQEFPRGESTQGPAFIIPMFPIDYSKIDEYNQRWNLWTILS
jgi:hypothetical protein